MRLALALVLTLALVPAAARAATIWPATATPATAAFQDNAANNLGVKFRSDQAGFVRAIRFYKGAQNTGTHVGSLWSAGGALLASATFTNETASGWQEVALPNPVAIAANTTYVASYHTDTGFYAYTGAAFASAGVDAPPLHALSDAAGGGNGVYLYGANAFPAASFNAANYWIDVVFDTSAADTTAPTVTASSPAPGATGVPANAVVSATFSEPVAATSIVMSVSASSGVAGTTTYDAATRTARFTPSAPLATTTPATTYTASVSGAQDSAGNTMAPVSWKFTTAEPAPPTPTPTPTPGPTDAPIVLVGSSANPFTAYYTDILRAEGLNASRSVDVSQLSVSTLAGADVVVLGEVALTSAQVTALSDFVNAGGNLIAMRPDAKLAGLLGLVKGTGTRAEGYLAVNPAVEAAGGITAATMQYHGTADRYTLSGATSVANLYTSATAATSEPAVSLRTVGANGGQAAAFTFDLARSVVYTHQGNPAWAGQSRDDLFPIRSHELFRGVSTTDWVNLGKVAIPQADEQQRLLANLIETMNRHRKPLPRFWYFPRSLKAVIIGTGDDHGGGGTAGRFDQYRANSPAGCSVADWTCLRFTSFVFPSDVPLTNAQAATYNSQGFEIALHPDTGCDDFTDASLAQVFTTQLAQFRQKFSSLPSPVTNRTHCLVWSTWVGEPKAELANGMRFDATYYYWPQAWIRNRPGFMTGSGIPMRFADTTGAALNVYGSPTVMTDESGQSYPMTVDTLLNNALGATGYYGAFLTNLHTDGDTEPESDAVLSSARSHGVPIVSARQMLTWLNGRDASAFSGLSWNGGTLTFTLAAGAGATGLTAMVPTASAGGALSAITRDGTPVTYSVQTIKGLSYAFFNAVAGTYAARYGGASAASAGRRVTRVLPPPAIRTGARAPRILGVRAFALPDRSAAVEWRTSARADGRVEFGRSRAALDDSRLGSGVVTAHSVVLSRLAPGRRYFYRVRSGHTVSAVRRFIVPAYGVADSRLAQWRMGRRVGVAAVAHGDGELRARRAGTYVSRRLDVRQMVRWTRARWDARGRIVVRVRSGSTSSPDGSWTPWQRVARNGARLPARLRPSRYLQYSVRLQRGARLRAIGFSSTGSAPRTPTESGGRR